MISNKWWAMIRNALKLLETTGWWKRYIDEIDMSLQGAVRMSISRQILLIEKKKGKFTI